VGLEALNLRVHKDLQLLNYPCSDWVLPRTTRAGEPVHNVVVVGGGQSGISLAFALQREFVSQVLVVDRNLEFKEGPWLTHGRMRTLLTPKDITGVDQGVPSLTFQAWYEAQYGEAAYTAMMRIPRATWAAYLNWVRVRVGLNVWNNTEVAATNFSPEDGAWRVTLTSVDSPTESRDIFCRKIVFATGFDGLGYWKDLPDVRAALAPHLVSTARGDIDFDALRGRRVAVIGNGASGFDAAGVALEGGATVVHLFGRRRKAHLTNLHWRWTRNVGFLKHHADSSDANKIRTIGQLSAISPLPLSSDSSRATDHTNFYLHEDDRTGDTFSHVEHTAQDTAVVVAHNGQRYEVDHVIIAVGIEVDPARVPALRTVLPAALMWTDMPGNACLPPTFVNYPYLGRSFELLAKTQAAPAAQGHSHPLNSVFLFSLAGLLSCGLGGCAVPGIKYGVRRVVDAITNQLYQEDHAHHFRTLESLFPKEFRIEGSDKESKRACAVASATRG